MQKRSDFDRFHHAQLSGEPESEWDLGKDYEDAYNSDAENDGAAMPDNADLPAWGPPSGFPEQSDLPSWGPPSGFPEQPDLPSWGPPSGMPEQPDLPQWGPPAQMPGWTEGPQWTGRYCNIRFIHAAADGPQVDIYVNQVQMISAVQYSELTEYFMVRSGQTVVTIRQTEGGQVVNQTSFLLENGGLYTVAIVNSAAGIALYLMEDVACNKSVYNSCIRVANLTNQAPALDIIMNEGRTLFSNVRFLDVTDYKQISPGTYDFGAARSGGCQTLPQIQPRRVVQIIPIVIGETCRQEVFVTAQRTIERDRVYTMYIIGNAYSQPYMNMILAESYFDSY